MAYMVMDSMREQYGLRPGLEGPFNFAGRVLYYDTKEGQYYCPRTDCYLSNEEMDIVHSQVARTVAR